MIRENQNTGIFTHIYVLHTALKITHTEVQQYYRMGCTNSTVHFQKGHSTSKLSRMMVQSKLGPAYFYNPIFYVSIRSRLDYFSQFICHSRRDGPFLNNAQASLYIATRLEKTARTIMKIDKILSLFVDMPYRSLHQ